MKHRTTHTLLAVVVALLGLHLALRLSPQEAVAQEPELWAEAGRPAPKIVATAASAQGNFNFLVRIWNDGFAEYRGGWGGGQAIQPQAWTPLPDNPEAPRSRPIAVSAAWGNPLIVYRQWANGTVDWLSIIVADNGTGDFEFFPDPIWRTEPQ